MVIEAWQTAKRILAVRLDNLGDVLVTTPALHAIKQSLPDCHLTLLASPVGAQVGRLNPDVDDVITYQAPWMDPWHTLPQDSAREQAMIARIKAGQYDGAIIFTSYHQSPLPAAYLCYLADIPLRAAASIDGPGSLLTTRHKHPERMMHEVERGLDLVAALGMSTEERDLVLRLPDAARRNAWEVYGTGHGEHGKSTEGHGIDQLIPPLHRSGEGARGWGHPLIVVHPGCSMPARTYPWEQFAEVVELAVADLGATVMLTGAPEERELVDRIFARLTLAAQEQTQRRAGELPFAEFCALIGRADLIITNNTGPMHIAAALQTPVVALFALTNPPEQWGPWHVPHRQMYHDVPCRICYSRVCPYTHDCLRLVTASMVIQAARELLEAPSTSPVTFTMEGSVAHE